jgi:hypothetical protein
MLVITHLKSGSMSPSSQGLFLSGHHHQHHSNSSPDNCSQRCDAMSECVGFNFGNSDNTCVLLSSLTGPPVCGSNSVMGVKC